MLSVNCSFSKYILIKRVHIDDRESVLKFLKTSRENIIYRIRVVTNNFYYMAVGLCFPPNPSAKNSNLSQLLPCELKSTDIMFRAKFTFQKFKLNL